MAGEAPPGPVGLGCAASAARRIRSSPALTTPRTSERPITVVVCRPASAASSWGEYWAAGPCGGGRPVSATYWA